MSYQPPFTITTEVVDFISAVNESLGFASVNASRNALVNCKSVLPTDQVSDYVGDQVCHLEFGKVMK